MTMHTVSTSAALREIYGTPRPDSYAVHCVLPHLDKHHRAFIALAPFLVLASADAQGRPDVSPRGDVPGFVAVLDEHTLVIPEICRTPGMQATAYSVRCAPAARRA